LTYPIADLALALTLLYVVAWLIATGLGRAGFPAPSGEDRIGCVDGLRGYLALSVLAHHFIIWLQIERLGGAWAAPTVNLFNQLGAGAVALFFMLTGLLFYPVVLRGPRGTPWPGLYVRRVFRIVPLIAASVAIITVIIVLRTGRGLDRDFPVAAATWIAALGMPPLLGHADSGRLNAYVLWSLHYEWLFYLFVLPLCALAASLVRDRLPSWTVPAGLLLGSLSAQSLSPPGLLVQLLPLFAIGMLAYELRSREPVARLLRSRAATALALASLALAVSAFETPYGYAMPLLAVFFICIACGNDLGGLLRSRGSLVLGELSYGVYLLHGVLLSLLFVDMAALLPARPGGVALLLPLAGVAVLLLTPLTFLAIERPAIAAGRRIARSLRRPPRAVEMPARSEQLGSSGPAL
jgi:peptidoglycan/LPS O-acetylase OafA/YrhL